MPAISIPSIAGSSISKPQYGSASSSSASLANLQNLYQTNVAPMAQTMEVKPIKSAPKPEAVKVFRPVETGTKDSKGAVNEAYRFTKEERQQVEHSAAVKSALASQGLAYISRDEIEQLKKLKESGNLREYELLRSKLMAKRQATEDVALKNAQSWSQGRDSILEVIRQKTERIEALEKNLKEIVEVVNKHKELDAQSLHNLELVDDEFADILQFSLTNLFRAPDRLLLTMTPQLVDAFMISAFLLDQMRMHEGLFKNLLNASWFQLFAVSPDGFSWGPSAQYSLITTIPGNKTNPPTAAPYIGQTFFARNSFSLELNMFECSPLLNVPPDPVSFYRGVNGVYQLYPGAYEAATTFIGAAAPNIRAAAPVPNLDPNTAAVHNNNPGYYDPTWAPLAFFMAMDAGDVMTNRLAMPIYRQIGGGPGVYSNGLSFTFNVNRGRVFSLDAHVRLPMIIRMLHENREILDAEHTKQYMAEITKLPGIQKMFKQTYSAMIKENLKRLEASIGKNKLCVFNMSLISTMIMENLMSSAGHINHTATAVVEDLAGISLSYFNTTSTSINQLLMDELTLCNQWLNTFLNNEHWLVVMDLIGWWNLGVQMIQSLVMLGSHLFPSLNRHQDFNMSSKLGNILNVMRKLTWRVVFVEQDEQRNRNFLAVVADTLYLFTMLFYMWLKNDVFQASAQVTAFMQYVQAGRTDADRAAYRSLVENVFNSSNYMSFYDYELTVQRPLTRVVAQVRCIGVMEDLLRFVMTETSTILPEPQTSEVEAPNLSQAGTYDFEML